MVVSSADLDRLSDDIYRDRKISSSVYCGTCGYNLRTLPYVYQCPECGQEYNARPLKMRGIFNPYDTQVPFRDVFVTLLSAVCTTVLAYSWYQTGRAVWFFMGVGFAVFTILFTRQAYIRIRVFFRATGIARRIMMERQ